MDRGAWHATIHGGHKSVEHDLATKQQQSRKKHSIFSSDAYLPDQLSNSTSTWNFHPQPGSWERFLIVPLYSHDHPGLPAGGTPG